MTTITQAKSTVDEISAEQFNEVIEQHSGKVLIDFYAPWCAPCKMIAPVVKQIAEENELLKVVKINADNSQELMAKFGIRGLPTLLLMNNGQVVGTQVGAASVSQVTNFISSH
jgi:thioredoxin 1